MQEREATGWVIGLGEARVVETEEANLFRVDVDGAIRFRGKLTGEDLDVAEVSPELRRELGLLALQALDG